MTKIFGFSDDDFASLPDDVDVQSTTTLSGGQSLEETDGSVTNRYTTTGDDS